MGLAVLGTVMAARFASNVAKEIQPSGSLTQKLVSDLSKNPRVMVDEEALTALESTLTHSGADGPDLAQQIVYSLREVLSWALSDVFLVTLGVTIAAIVVTVFLKEIPLSSRNSSHLPSSSKPSDVTEQTTR